MSAKRALLLIPVFLAGIVLTVSVVLRNTKQSTTERDRAELEALVKASQAASPRDPAAVVADLRKAEESAAKGASPAALDPRKIKDELRRAGDAALPTVRKVILDPAEPILLRMELVGVAADVRSSASDSLVTGVFGERTLDERLRATALAKLTGRDSEAFFQALRKTYEEEPQYGGRHLVLRAIADSRRPDATPILLEASKKETSVSARIQAIDGLGSRVSDPAVLQTLRETFTREPEENVRLAAISALARSPDASASELLREISQNPEASALLRKAAASHLEARARPR